MTIVEAVVLAVVEGITEYLPISSTGHMIIVSSLMGIASDDFVKMFTVAIQFGAILSVIVLYWKKFLQSFDFYLKLLVAFIPAALFGKLFDDQIDALLENVIAVAIALLAGGVVLLFIDRWLNDERDSNDELTYGKVLRIGFFQVIAMIPGISRSAATIIGGLTQKLSRKAAAEFSFFLAVPTMFAATVYKMYKFIDQGNSIGSEQITLLFIGNIVAFIVAMIAIKGFIAYLTKHGFRIFGWYRIALALIILIRYFLHYPMQVI
ncbi:MAG: undecaprenyl-diphosphate phosphatase [Sphingobacteriales bacterium]|nr:undecaprenyl-diphosphate phosphatase [Sphingobacteriales bacterium]